MFFRKTPGEARHAVAYCITSGQIAGISSDQQARISAALDTLWGCAPFNEVNKTWANSSTRKFIELCMGWA